MPIFGCWHFLVVVKSKIYTLAIICKSTLGVEIFKDYLILAAQYSRTIFLVASGSEMYPSFLADLSPFLKA